MTEQLQYEASYLPLGPFKVRFPFIHYKVEKVEFIQGIILGATALSATVYLMDALGVSYDLAYNLVIFETSLYMLHVLLGDPVIPGWITASLPLTLVYLADFQMGSERIQALAALQILVGIIFVVMGITGFAKKFVGLVPSSIKGAILMAAPISVLQGQLSDTGGMHTYPIALLAGFLSLVIISYSTFYAKLRKKYKIFDLIGKYGNLFPYLIAMVVGLLIGELSPNPVEWGSIIHLLNLKFVFGQMSVFTNGFPPVSFFLRAFPLALIIYIISFGDFITSQSLVKDAKTERDDEIVDFNENRSNLIVGFRNLLLGTLSPFPPMAGPLWAGMMVSTTQRYKEGKGAMDTLIGGMGSFRIATFLCVMILPLTSFLKPVFAVGGAITLMFQAIVSGRIGLDFCENDLDRLIAPFTAAVIAFAGSGWGLLVGFALNFILGNISMNELKK